VKHLYVTMLSAHHADEVIIIYYLMVSLIDLSLE